MWVVDTCVLIDIADDDPDFGLASARCLASCMGDGLRISPVTYVELAPVFENSVRLVDEFLAGLAVDHEVDVDAATKRAAFSAWGRYISDKRAGRAPKRPIADVLIAAMASQHRGIITRNGHDFSAIIPTLEILDPTAAA